MLSKRIVANWKGRNWTTIGIEFLIVVFGVFAGLQAQEWYEYRSDRSAERQYANRLIADFSAIQQDVEQCLSLYRGSIEAIDTVEEAIKHRLESEQSTTASPRGLETALLRATAGVAPPGRSATFVEMLSTGDLSLLRDSRLRQALTAYDQRAQVNRETWRSLREIQDEYIGPLYDNVTLVVDPDAKQVSTVGDFDLAGLAGDPRSRAMLNVLVAAKANNYELCDLQAKRIAEVRAALAGSP